jgi:DNA-binding SARP family transcriptional activator
VTKDELIDHLWGERAPRDPIATLEAYVSVLRSNLQPGVSRDESVIATEAGAYRFVRERAIIDVDRFDAMIDSINADHP